KIGAWKGQGKRLYHRLRFIPKYQSITNTKPKSATIPQTMAFGLASVFVSVATSLLSNSFRPELSVVNDTTVFVSDSSCFFDLSVSFAFFLCVSFAPIAEI